MLKDTTLRGLAFLALVTSFPCALFAAQPRLVIDTPRGGECYFEGQTQQIRVTTRIRQLDVELSRDGGATYVSLGTIDNTVHDVSLRGVMSWKVTLPASKFCLIRITDPVKQFTQVSQQFSIGFQDGNGATPGGENGALGDGSVVTSKLADGSVTTPKLADLAVTTPKLADVSVTAPKMNSGPASSSFLLAADGLGGASWVPPGSLLVSPNFGSQPIVTTGSLTAGSIFTGDLSVSGTLTLPPNSIATAALPVGVTLQGNAFNGASQLVQLDNVGKLAIGLLQSTVTAQGNTFNGVSQLVKLDNAGKLPAIDGSALTGIAVSQLNGQSAAYYLDRAHHTGTQLAATISDFDSQVRTSKLNQLATPAADVAFGGFKITGLADPAAAQDAATMNYVDAQNTAQNTAQATALSNKVAKAGDTMTGTLNIVADGAKLLSKAGPGDAITVKKLEVQKNDGTSAFSVIASGDLHVGSSIFSIDQGGSLELGGDNTGPNPVTGGVPFIDFHFGNGIAEDFNTRIMNSADKRIDFMMVGLGEVFTIKGYDVGIGIGNQNPAARFQVKGGAIMPDAGATSSSGIYFPQNIGGGGGDEAWMRYYVYNGPEDTTLEFGTKNDLADKIAFIQNGGERLTIKNGHVGVGALDPTDMLEINGDRNGIFMNGVNANIISYNTQGVDVPSFNSRSDGTKMMLFPNLSSSSVDYALGIEPFHMWFSVPQAASNTGFKFYGGTTSVFSINGDGQLESGGDRKGFYLNATNSNLIRFNDQGVAAPSFNTRSDGTKLMLFPEVGATASDYAIGIEPSHMWLSVPAAVPSKGFKFYGGTTELFTINGDGTVGIGLNSGTPPAAKLDLAGDMNITKNGIGLNINHTIADGTGWSKLNFNSSSNPGTDQGFFLFQDNSGQNTGAGGIEHSRFTIGVYNDADPNNSDELWLQGCARMVHNVGAWDSELNSIVGGVAGTMNAANFAYEWRINNGRMLGLSTSGCFYVDTGNNNIGSIGSGSLRFGDAGTGEGMGSNRGNSGNQFGLDFYTGFMTRMTIANTGNVDHAVSMSVGGGTPVTKILSAAATLDFPSTATNSSSDLTITVTGAVDGDTVSLGTPGAAVLPNSCYSAWVSAANTVTVRFLNTDAGAQDPASATFRVTVVKF